MRKKTLTVLEYDKIIEQLIEQAGSEMTKKVISELMPCNDAVSYTHLDVYKRQGRDHVYVFGKRENKKTYFYRSLSGISNGSSASDDGFPYHKRERLGDGGKCIRKKNGIWK